MAYQRFKPITFTAALADGSASEVELDMPTDKVVDRRNRGGKLRAIKIKAVDIVLSDLTFDDDGYADLFVARKSGITSLDLADDDILFGMRIQKSLVTSGVEFVQMPIKAYPTGGPVLSPWPKVYVVFQNQTNVAQTAKGRLYYEPVDVWPDEFNQELMNPM